MKFSIAIPVKGHLEELKQTLIMCKNQYMFCDYEIVIADNMNDEEELTKILDAVECDKIKCFRTPELYSIQQNFDFAVSCASGDYVMILGAKEGISQYCLYILNYITKLTDENVIAWGRFVYNYRDCSVDADRIISECYSSRLVMMEDWLKLEYESPRGIAKRIPFMYTSAIVKRDLIDKIEKKYGTKLHQYSTQDYYQAVLTGIYNRKFLYLGLPLTVYGITGNSGQQVCIKYSGDKLLKNLNGKAGGFFDKYVFYTLNQAALIMSRLEIGLALKDNIEAEGYKLKYNYKKFLQMSMEECQYKMKLNKDVDCYKDVITETKKDLLNLGQQDIIDWFTQKYSVRDDDIKQILNEVDYKQMYYNGFPVIYGEAMGIENISQVMKLIESMFLERKVDTFLEQFTYSWNTLKDVCNIIKKYVYKGMIGIYGTGGNTEKLIKAYEFMMGEKLQNYIYIDSYSDGKQNLNGHQIINVNSINDYGLSAVLISSYEYRSEMLCNVKKIGPDIKIIDMYENAEFFYLGFLQGD